MYITMKLSEKDYVLERTTDGGFYAYLSRNMQCSAYGDTPEETIENLTEATEEYIDDIYMVEDYA